MKKQKVQWRKMIRSISRRYEGLLLAMSRPPDQHQEDLFGPRKGPEEVLAALKKAKNRTEISWAMSWAWGWRHLLEENSEEWPEDQRAGLWDEIWTIYLNQYEKLSGQAPLIDREKYERHA
ncbi:hypothetical protein ACFL2T_00230 [Elusimicrobiota bacterium]